MLRLGTSDTMAKLDDFLNHPTPFNASRLVSIPALYQVLRAEQSKTGRYPQPILEMAQWICERAWEVRKVLMDRGADLETDSNGAVVNDSWEQVSAEVC